jgi:MFS family permease
MNRSEIRATATLSLIYALRMFGMFMILPVFALYARDLPGGATPLQIGLAIGAYALVQAFLQIPFGMLSDRIGRKPVIVSGLLLFAIGSAVAGSTHDIHWIILGRAIQGAGAISGAVSALLADVTRPQVRTQAMAILGAGIGLSFIIALVLGPILDGLIGVAGIFWMTGVLALLAIPVVLRGVPDVPLPTADAGRTLRSLKSALADSQLLRLDGGILLLHAMMTCLFLAAPMAIEQTLGLPAPRHWEVYLPVLLISILPVFPLIRWVEPRGYAKPAFIAAVATLGIALLLAAATHAHATGLFAALLVFFVAFNYLEGSLPSMISRRAPLAQKGAALGVYSTAQFLGGFFGSQLGGFMLGHVGWGGGIGGVFAAAAVLSVLWLSFAVGLVPIQAHAAPVETAH